MYIPKTVRFLTALVVLSTFGCGAMFNNNRTLVPISVFPPTADVYVDGQVVTGRPLSLETNKQHSIRVAATGYEQQSVEIDASASGGYIVGDILLLWFFILPGVIALAVDGGTGSWRTLDLSNLSVTLVRSPEPPAPPASKVEPPASTQPSGCQYDIQCKGDRVCIGGQCVIQSANVLAPNPFSQ